MNQRINSLGKSISSFEAKGISKDTKLRFQETFKGTIRVSDGKGNFINQFGRTVSQLLHKISQLPQEKQNKLSHDGKILKDFVIKTLGKEKGTEFLESKKDLFRKENISLQDLKDLQQDFPSLYSLSQEGQETLKYCFAPNSDNKVNVLREARKILSASDKAIKDNLSRNEALKIASLSVGDTINKTKNSKTALLVAKRKNFHEAFIKVLSEKIIDMKQSLSEADNEKISKALEYFLSKEDFHHGFLDRLSLFLEL